MSKDQILLIEGGFMTNEGNLTEDGKGYIRYLTFETYKEALLKRAKEKIAEAKAKAKEEATDETAE